MARRLVATVVVAVLVVSAGCVGILGPEQTEPTTPTPTETPTETPMPEPTTDTPTPTTTATSTTPTPTASFKLSYPVAFDAVRDGTLSVPVTVENTGNAAGTRTVTVTLDRVVSDHYTETVTETVKLQPGERVTRTYEYDFQATGEYTVLVDGDRVGSVTVESLDTRGHSGGSESTTTTADANVSGESNPGAE